MSIEQSVVIRYVSGTKGSAIEEIPITGRKELIVGRGPSCDIRYDLDSDDLVSRRHMKIEIAGADQPEFTAVDLNSRNGTFLNKRRIRKPTRLQPGDVVQLGSGGPEFVFDLMPPTAESPLPSDETAAYNRAGELTAVANRRIEKTVFISYRRVNVAWALAIFQNLTNHGYDVFFDYRGIASGDFERIILDNIAARAHFLVLLTPSALDCCGEPEDWLRREIEHAIGTRRNVVALKLEGFDFGNSEIKTKLTGALAPLARYNALDVYPAYFPEGMARLREQFLNVALEGVLHPVSPVAQQAVKEQQAAARTARLVEEAELTAEKLFER